MFEKKVRKSHFSEKKVLGCKKRGIANSKIDKNRIYLRRKGDNKNRKKKDFFPPPIGMDFKISNSMMTYLVKEEW